MQTTKATIATVAALCCAAVSAQPAQPKGATVPYNEAVKVVGGQRQVQLPPMSNDDKVSFYEPGFSKGDRYIGLYMIETAAGLVECVDPLYHARACRPSTYGQKELYRTWIVLRTGEWQMCLGPQRVERCLRIVYPKPGAISNRPMTVGVPTRKH
jgi:hypothetical protein